MKRKPGKFPKQLQRREQIFRKKKFRKAKGVKNEPVTSFTKKCECRNLSEKPSNRDECRRGRGESWGTLAKRRDGKVLQVPVKVEKGGKALQKKRH